jgi:hypothetical protein
VLRGCQNDLDCGSSQTCARDPAATADVTSGLCLDRTNLQAHIATCGPLLRSARIYRILSVKQGVQTDDPYAPSGREVTDQLTFAPIFQPEHPVDTQACTTDGECAQVTSPDASGAPLNTRCLLDPSGVRRCLVPCDPAAPRCGLSFACANAAGTDGPADFRCMRAPLPDQTLLDTCLRELQPYEVHAGEAFLVSGTVSGVYAFDQPNSQTRECEIPQSSAASVQLRQSRIPVVPLGPNPVLCSDPTIYGRPLPPLETLGPGRPNVCLLQPEREAVSRQIHFENPVLIFELNLPSGHLVPPDRFILSFNIVGGYRPMQIALTVDVQALQPRAAITAPDRQTVFVVDEGKQATATGLRGQLLRLVSASQTVDPFFKVR